MLTGIDFRLPKGLAASGSMPLRPGTHTIDGHLPPTRIGNEELHEEEEGIIQQYD